MSDAILGQVALGYSPFIDRNRAVTATRLTVFPLNPEATLDAVQLLQAVGSVWPLAATHAAARMARIGKAIRNLAAAGNLRRRC